MDYLDDSDRLAVDPSAAEIETACTEIRRSWPWWRLNKYRMPEVQLDKLEQSLREMEQQNG